MHIGCKFYPCVVDLPEEGAGALCGVADAVMYSAIGPLLESNPEADTYSLTTRSLEDEETILGFSNPSMSKRLLLCWRWSGVPVETAISYASACKLQRSSECMLSGA